MSDRAEARALRDTPRRAAVAAGLALAALYAAAAAPDVTFWDAGEFLAAFSTFGAPHPPGTPLYVALGRAWTLGAVALGTDAAYAGNLLSGACTALAGACTAWLVARWTRSGVCGVAAALCAGAMTTAWANATEAEVYAAALALACLGLVAGERAGARPPDRAGGARAAAATAYALALAVPLHLTALVASPAAIWLASAPPNALATRRPPRWTRALALVSAATLAAGAGTARLALAATGAAGLGAAMLIAPARTARARLVRPRLDAEPLAVAGAVALALSAVAILVVRARHDPWLNQGDPSTWARLVDVVGRRQYNVAGLWPRQAPWWLQLANLGQWADWQFALGLAPGVAPSAPRTAVTLAYAALGAWGSAWHRRRDARSWVAVLLLLGAGSLGVAVYLNLKPGPSFGWGVLPDAAPHEARERDYFYLFAWWAWGIWAGVGCVAAVGATVAVITRTIGRPTGWGSAVVLRPFGVGAAALPVVLNWPVTSRARRPEAGAAAAYARALLENAPARAVLVVNGDNDTYPLWFAQAVRHVRPDVTVVTASLLPAQWYRAELARRGGLLPPAGVARWLGPAPTLALVAERAGIARRPLAASLAVDTTARAALAGGRRQWRLRGLTLALDSVGSASDSNIVALGPAVRAAIGVAYGDRAALVASTRIPPIPPAWRTDSIGDGVTAWAYRQLSCPSAALASATHGDAAPTALPASTAAALRLEAPCRAR